MPDYYKALPEFEAQVENDALSFKPFGQLIYSYTRPSPSAKGKGKFPASQSLDAESEDIVVYEVYHVSGAIMLRSEPDHVPIGHTQHTRLPRLCAEDANLHPVIHRSWLVH